MTPQEAIFKVLTELQTKGQWVLVWGSPRASGCARGSPASRPGSALGYRA